MRSRSRPMARVDVVVDTVGGETGERALGLIKPGGILVSVVSVGTAPQRSGVRSVFFYAEVTTARPRDLLAKADQGEFEIEDRCLLRDNRRQLSSANNFDCGCQRGCVLFSGAFAPNSITSTTHTAS
jgi:NADPH:quinone reductase-like Zn-dependent oxidoreductase